MNDYKGLIDSLRICVKYKKAAEALCNAEFAADAIEQLVKERDEWKTLGSLANKRAEDYRDMRRQRDKAIKERDAAIAEIDGVCLNCAHSRRYNGEEMCKYIEECSFSEKDKNPSKWEWRGVQEAEHEID